MAMTLTVFGALFTVPQAAIGEGADIGWGSPTPLTNHVVGDATSVGVAMDSFGDAVAGWIHQNGQRGLPSANLFTEATGWQVPSVLSRGPDSAVTFRASVAMDDFGDAIAVWSDYWYIMASRYTMGTGWEPALQIGYCCTYSADPVIAMNPSGDAVVAWWQWDGSQYSIFGNTYRAGAGWTGTTWLEGNNGGGAFVPRVGIDSSGNAIAVWYEWDSVAGLIRVGSNRYVAGIGWGTAAYLSPAGAYAYYPDIAVNRDGSALVVYNDNGGAIRWIPYATGPGWGAVGTVDSGFAFPSAPRVATDAGTGDAVGVWIRAEASGNNVYTSNYNAALTTWSAPALRETSTFPASVPVVAVNRLGRALIAWQQSDGTFAQVYSRFYDPGTGWSGVYVMASGLAGDKLAPSVAMSDFGTGVVAYQAKDGERYSIYANRFTGTGFNFRALVEFDNQGGTYNNRIAANAAGQAAVVWWQDDGPIANLYGATFDPASGWTPATLLEFRDTGNAVDAQVALDESGNAFALWVQWDGSWDVWSARYQVTTGWQAPYMMESMSGDAGYPEVAFDAAGNALATWYQSDGTSFNVYGSVWSGGWTAPVALESGTGDAYEPHLAFAPNGRAIVSWHQFDGSYDSIYFNTYSPGAGWGTEALVEGQAAWTRWVRIAMNDAGQAILIWHQWNGAGYDLWADRWDGNGWTGEILIESLPGWVNWPWIAIDGQGNGIASWHAWDATEWNVYRVEFRDGMWRSPQLLTPGAGDAFDSAVVADEDGNMIVAWTQWTGAAYGIQSQRLTAETGWVATAPMTEMGLGASYPKLAADGAGNVLAVFNRYDGERWLPWVTAYTEGDGAPSLILFEPSATLTTDPMVAVSGQTDPGVRVSVDGVGIPTDAQGRFTYSVFLADGPHTFVVRAINLAGRMRIATATITVDTTAPYASISSPGDGYATNSPTIPVWGSAEPGSTVDVNGIAVSPDIMGSFIVTVPLVEGTQPVRVTARDAAGNVGSATISVTLDTIAPALYLLPLPQITNVPTVVVQGSTEPTATVLVDGNPVFVNPGTGDFMYTALSLPEGPHTFVIAATDAVGNSASRQETVVVDSVAPLLQLTDPVDGLVTRNPLVSVYGTTEPGVRVMVNGIEVSVGPSGDFFARIPLAEGTQVLRADATDAAGNTATVSISVTVDTIAPELALASPADGFITNLRNILVSGLTEPGASVTVNGVGVAVLPDGSFAYTAPNLPDGVHTFDVVATDPAGNVAREFRTATVDASPPVVSILAPAGGTTVDIPTVTVSGTTEPGVSLVVNGVSVAVDPSSGMFSFLLALADGTNTIMATATDAAGNEGTDSVVVTYVNPVPNLEQQLQQIQIELDQTQQDLQNTQLELQQTQQDLQDTQAALDAANDALTATQADLDTTNTQLAQTNASLAGLGTQLLILLVLLVVSLAFGAMQFLSIRKLRSGGGGGSGGASKTDASKPDE